MRSVLAVVVLLAGCDQLFGLQHLDDPPTSTDFAFRKRITIAPTGDLDDFVVLVQRTDPQLAAHADASGRDIVFTAADGQTLLPFELVSYSDGEIEAWVRVPHLSNDATDIFMLYGGPVGSPPSSPWTRSDHAAVWHLSDSGLLERDRSDYHNDLTDGPMPARAAGIAGDAVMVAGGRICVSPDNGSLNFARGSFSFSMWTKATVTKLEVPMARGGHATNVAGYDFEVGTHWVVDVGDGIQLDTLDGPPPTTNWTFLAASIDRTTNLMTFYVDGGNVDSGVLSVATVESDQPSCIGGIDNDVYNYLGIIDEPRVYSAALPPAWFDAEYQNLANPSTFLTVGAEETAL